MQSSPHINALLQGALRSAQAGRFDRAEEHARQVLADVPDHFNALQFLGLIRSKQGDMQEAEKLMSRSLELEPNQPHVWNNLGNVYGKIPDPEKAVRCYRQAVTIEPRYFDAWKNLGLTLAARDKHDEALDAYNRALTLSEMDHDVLNGKGLSLRALKRFSEAETVLLEAIKYAPTSVNALNNLGNVLRDRGKDNEAATIFEKASELAPEAGHLRVAQAGAYINLGRFEDAVENLLHVIDKEPDNLEAHKSLTKTLFNINRGEDIPGIYEKTLTNNPNLKFVWEEYVESLWLLDKFEEGLSTAQRAMEQCGETPRLRLLAGRMTSSGGDPGKALQWLDLSGRNDTRLESFFAVERARCYLRLGDYRRGADDLTAVANKFPDDYSIIAHQESLLRMANDPQADWLMDYDRFVRPVAVPTPDGFQNNEEFLSALAECLTALHVSKSHPIDQTLRGGTQTYGHLFERTEPIIQSLKAAIQEAVEAYASTLTPDPGHPFLKHAGQSVWFKGCWSVRLRSEGYHVHHYHPEGWISSAYYVALPASVADPEREDGRIQFGIPPVEVPDPVAPVKEIQPQTGGLVLFPSYCWHGTVPFSDPDPRITVAFDVGRGAH